MRYVSNQFMLFPLMTVALMQRALFKEKTCFPQFSELVGRVTISIFHRILLAPSPLFLGMITLSSQDYVGLAKYNHRSISGALLG